MSTLQPDPIGQFDSVSAVCPPITADPAHRLFPSEPEQSELDVDEACRLTGAEQARLYFTQGMATPDIPVHLALVWIVARDEPEALSRWFEARLRRLPLANDEGQKAAMTELLDTLRRGEIIATGKGRGRRRAIPPLRWRDLKLGNHGSAVVAYESLLYRFEYREVEVDSRRLLGLWPPAPKCNATTKHSLAETRRVQNRLTEIIRTDTEQALTRVALRADPLLAGFGRNQRERLITAAMMDAGVDYLIKPGRRPSRRRALSA